MKSAIWQAEPSPVLVALHGVAFPSDEEWERHMDVARGLREQIGAAPLRILIFSDGAGPTAAQRARLNERPGRRPALGALVTSSRLAAGIGAVMSVSYPGVRIFEPRDFHRALAHMGIAHAELPALLAHIHAIAGDFRLECIAELEVTLARAS